MDRHLDYMQQALSLARRGEGLTSPNPAVGAVVVNGGTVVGQGYHARAGGPHAEVEALKDAGAEARGATMYVILEPCSHFGRTPPCTEAIIKAGITRVFYAVPDPNPGVSGHGHERLVDAGLTVHQGLCEEDARYINRFYLFAVRTGKPYVLAKYAASLDGKIATHGGESRWITGPAARQKGHTLRRVVDAVLVGAGTVISDDPQLTARLPDKETRYPLRVIVDSRGRIPLHAHVFKSGIPGQTVVVTTEAMPAVYRTDLSDLGVEVLTVPAYENKRVNLEALLSELGRRRIMSVMVEGGGEIMGAFFSAGLVNEVWAFLAPKIIGGSEAPGPVGGSGFSTLKEATRLSSITTEYVDNDVLVRGYVDRNKEVTGCLQV